MDKTNELVKVLAGVVNAHERAKTDYDPEQNPFANHDLKRMASAGMRKSADTVPAVNMAAKDEPMLGTALEEARHTVIAEARADKSAKRMAQHKARAERKVEFDRLADAPVPVSAERMEQAWMVVLPMVPIIMRLANEKARYAARYLGTTTDDVPQMAIEKMALMLAKSDKDLGALEVAADELGHVAEATGKLPGDQSSKEEKAERKQVKRNRKWLMGVINNRVMGAIVDSYMSERNLRWDNIDIIATVLATINGPGHDPLTSNFKADRAPAFLGTRFQRPGGIDAALLATGINAAITEKGLDPLVEFILDDDHRRVDGAVKWTEHAEDIFKLTPGGNGAWLWDAVVAATTGRRRDGSAWPMDRARKARGDAARAHVRNLFEFLPSVIVGLVESFDFKPIGYNSESHRAILTSDFEWLLPEPDERRKVLAPVLKFGSAEEAAGALVEHLSDLVTGEDLVRSALNG